MNEIIPQQENQVIEQQNSENASSQLIRYINIDLRDIDAFGYMQQVFLENFSRAQYAKEYMPFWLFARSQKFLEKQYKKKLKEVLKQYKKTLFFEKQQQRKNKRIKRRQRFNNFFKSIFDKIARIFRKTKKE